MGKDKSLPREEVVSRTIFGVLLILSLFVSWGKWINLVLGVLFILSALKGGCVLCSFYKKK